MTAAFESIPRFSSPEEADAWMGARRDELRSMLDLAQVMTEYAHTFSWLPVPGAPDLRVGWSKTRMSNGKFGWALIDTTAKIHVVEFDLNGEPLHLNGEPLHTGLLKHGQCRLRREAQALAYRMAIQHCKAGPSWIDYMTREVERLETKGAR